MGLFDHLKELEDRQAEDRRRQNHDRIRVVITMVNEPEKDEPADYFYVQIKSTARLCQIMQEYQGACHPLSRGDFSLSPKNFAPRFGPQLTITDTAIWEVTQIWEDHGWREEFNRDHVAWALEDFFHTLTGYYAQVSFIK